MIFVKWFLLTLLDWALLLTVPVAAPVIALFTRWEEYGQTPYVWGWLWGTYDNPPQGDQGFVRKRCFFPGVTTGLKGYINRVQWMFRNPTYGYAKLCAIRYRQNYIVWVDGNPDISDKERKAGYYFATVRDAGKLICFEFYAVLPWSETRDFRIRLGWKVVTDKFKEQGFAPLVNTINPFDGYGNS